MIFEVGYVAVDKDGTVDFFFSKPERFKDCGMWTSKEGYEVLPIDREDLPEAWQKMTWEDEPVKVILKCENVDIEVRD